MKLKKIRIKNFKAIKDVTIELSDFTVLIGTNGSGKSSVLQALHWVFQSARNTNVVTNRNQKKGSTLSEQDAIYMPSPEYVSAGHNSSYGNFDKQPQLSLDVFGEGAEGESYTSSMWLKAARNEGVSVHVPSGNVITTAIRRSNREFSAYIPGVAGIASHEEKRSRIVVHRLAAAGDSNTVLRNILDLLRKRSDTDAKDGLFHVERFVSRVMGEFKLFIEFDDNKHRRINCYFQTKEMLSSKNCVRKPLELVGIGYLQVIQIFAYLVYFKPALLLIDEPDAHLHPGAQEKLVEVIADAAREFGTQVIMSTHSPSVVRALPADASLIWMKDGNLVDEGSDKARNLMGWGLLDRRVLFLTEDTQTEMLRAIISQWPELERSIAIWPLHGSAKLPPPESIADLRGLIDQRLSVVIHRDRDFLMEEEVERISKPYAEKGFALWATKCSDIESYWCTPDVIKNHFSLDEDEAKDLLKKALERSVSIDNSEQKRNSKRYDAVLQLNKGGKHRSYSDAEVLAEAGRHGDQFEVLGKILMKNIRILGVEDGLNKSDSFGKNIPITISNDLALDLKKVLLNAVDESSAP